MPGRRVPEDVYPGVDDRDKCRHQLLFGRQGGHVTIQHLEHLRGVAILAEKRAQHVLRLKCRDRRVDPVSSGIADDNGDPVLRECHDI
jgi:hypothetical protein